MCAIVGSSDKEKFLKLIEQNQYRGNTSWSVCQFEIGAFKHYEDGQEFRLVNLFQGYDEFDTDIRNKFQFGHTFGHAIETATKYFINHGMLHWLI